MKGVKDKAYLETASEGGEFTTPRNREAMPASLSYKLFRRLLRIWFALALRKVRLFGQEAPGNSGPAILLVNHPASFFDALLLVAAFEDQVHCVLEGKFLRGIWRRLAARSLAMISLQADIEGWNSAITPCCDVLSKQGKLAVFAEERVRAPVGTSRQFERVALLAGEAESRNPEQPTVSVSPVYLFLPVEHSQSRETLICVGAPVTIEDLPLQTPTDPAERTPALAAALAKVSHENAFRLHSTDLRQFLHDLEVILRLDLGEEWAARENWKQRTEGFVLSQFVMQWADMLNDLHPGRLVALREAVDAYRESRRRRDLEALELETTPRLKKRVYRAVVWAESILGFPLALYGLLNHALIWLVLFSTGLLHKSSSRDRILEWVGRVLVALAFYTSQILLCDHMLGRAAAGYYAPSLPLSAAYLWRYRWLLQHRTRLAFLGLRLSSRAGNDQQMRAKLIERMSAGISSFDGMIETGL